MKCMIRFNYQCKSFFILDMMIFGYLMSDTVHRKDGEIDGIQINFCVQSLSAGKAQFPPYGATLPVPHPTPQTKVVAGKRLFEFVFPRLWSTATDNVVNGKEWQYTYSDRVAKKLCAVLHWNWKPFDTDRYIRTLLNALGRFMEHFAINLFRKPSGMDRFMGYLSICEHLQPL